MNSPKCSEGMQCEQASRRSSKRKVPVKGKPWTREEHSLFIQGLAIHGKGHWSSISRNHVTTRTPTQVASHAQKYVQRINSDKPKKRCSINDNIGSTSARDTSVLSTGKLNDANFGISESQPSVMQIRFTAATSVGPTDITKDLWVSAHKMESIAGTSTPQTSSTRGIEVNELFEFALTDMMISGKKSGPCQLTSGGTYELMPFIAEPTHPASIGMSPELLPFPEQLPSFTQMIPPESTAQNSFGYLGNLTLSIDGGSSMEIPQNLQYPDQVPVNTSKEEMILPKSYGILIPNPSVKRG